MALNYIWVFFILVAFATALIRLIVFQDLEVFPEVIKKTFEMASVGFDISIGLTGALTLWLGIMKIGERGGAIQLFSRLINPFFRKLFPEIPPNHPASGSIVMNLAANMLGLDNAATPLGLKAMKELQSLNPKKDTASNAQIMFLVLNTSGLTLIPISIMAIRAKAGAANPADIFIPILLATFVSTIAGLIAVSIVQKINLFSKVILVYLGGFSALVFSMIWYFSTLPKEKLAQISAVGSSVILFGIISLFVILAIRKKINVYEAFIEGAKEGFDVAIRIIPYLIAILVAIGVFRAAGCMDVVVLGIKLMFELFDVQTNFVDALPTAIMKPLSGGGARGMMVEAIDNFGVDSFVARLSSTFQGTTDTTFYVLAVYFGSVGIRKTRHAIACGLIADLAGIIAAIFIAYLFFG